MNESLVKYLAGLLDADGSLSFESHTGADGRVRISLKLHLVAAESIDRHGFVASLPKLTGFGNVSLGKYNQWSVGHRAQLEMLLPRVIKHMVIKAKHWQWLLDFWREWRSQEKGQKSLSIKEWEELRETCRASRRNNVGPLKPKNYPTWAWLAGYLDGDGCYSFRTSKNKNMRVSATAHKDDASVLEFIANSFGGTIKPNSRTDRVLVWWRGLGPAHSQFALNFASKLVKHSRLKKHKLEQLIHFHRQRLNIQRATA